MFTNKKVYESVNERNWEKMKISWKATMAFLFYALGVVGWLYFSGFMIITKPVKAVILAQMAGDLTIWKLVIAVVQGFLYLSLAGGVWCIGYILSNYFKDLKAAKDEEVAKGMKKSSAESR